jgi:Uma2 family endonuclease
MEPESEPAPWPKLPVLEPHHFLTEPMESEHHLIAMLLLYELVSELTHGRDDVFVGADLVVFFSDLQLKNRDFRAPDLVVVTGVEPRERQGWIVWEEGGRYPQLVVEHMSPSTRKTDLTTKLRIYGNIWQVREYYAFDLETGELHAFVHKDGGLVKRTPDSNGRYSSSVIDASFGVAAEGYRHLRKPVLRLYDRDGNRVPSGPERAAAAIELADGVAQRAEAATQRAEAEAQRAEAEAQRAEAEAQRAEAEAQRAASLEAEVRALKAKLGIA